MAALLPFVSTKWLVPVVYGYFEQVSCSVFGRAFSLILLARRSRHFAGTRYLKRGVNPAGHAANDVEVEQVVDDNWGRLSSFVQLRASIPVFWSQIGNIATPKPPILLGPVDPTFKAAQLHFAETMARYGSPILVLNLVKKNEKKPRESLIGSTFGELVRFLNTTLPFRHRIQYFPLDYSALSKKRMNVMRVLDDVAAWVETNCSFFSAVHPLVSNDHLPPPAPTVLGGLGDIGTPPRGRLGAGLPPRKSSFSSKPFSVLYPGMVETVFGDGSKGQGPAVPSSQYITSLSREFGREVAMFSDSWHAMAGVASSPRVPGPHDSLYTLFPVPDGAEGGGGSGSTSGLDPDSLAMTIAAPRRRSSVGHHRTSSTAMASAPPSHHHPIFTPVGREPRGDHFRTPSGLSSSMLPLGSMSTGAVRGTPTPRASIIGRHVEEAPSQPLPTFPMASTAGPVTVPRYSLLACGVGDGPLHESGPTNSLARRIADWEAVGGTSPYFYVDVRPTRDVQRMQDSASTSRPLDAAVVLGPRDEEPTRQAGGGLVGAFPRLSSATDSSVPPAADHTATHSGSAVSPDEVAVGLPVGGSGAGPSVVPGFDGEDDDVGANDDPMAPLMQCGTVRVNCVDCLDRTNVAQYYIGAHVLGKQLHALGILESPELNPRSVIVSLFASMFDALGDRIALQYGGSEANKKVTKQYRKDGGGADGGATTSGDSTSGSPGHAKATAQTAYVHSGAGGAEFLTSLKRYYNNVTKDALKQDAMNVFLGVYEPWRHDQHLWDMETDVHIHNAKVAAMVATSCLPRSLFHIVSGVCGRWWGPGIQTFAQALRDTGVRAVLPVDRRTWFLGTRGGLVFCETQHATNETTSFEDLLGQPFSQPRELCKDAGAAAAARARAGTEITAQVLSPAPKKEGAEPFYPKPAWASRPRRTDSTGSMASARLTGDATILGDMPGRGGIGSPFPVASPPKPGGGYHEPALPLLGSEEAYAAAINPCPLEGDGSDWKRDCDWQFRNGCTTVIKVGQYTGLRRQRQLLELIAPSLSSMAMDPTRLRMYQDSLAQDHLCQDVSLVPSVHLRP